MSLTWKDEGLGARLARVLEESEHLEDDLADGAEVVLRESDALVPKVSGDLAGTGRVDKDAGGVNTVKIAYSSVYARWIHEHLGFHHPHGGQAKFLETALLTKGRDALEKAASNVWGRL